MIEPPKNPGSRLALFFTLALATLSLLCPCPAFSQGESLKLMEFSHTNSVSILLGESSRGRETGDNGLRHPFTGGGDARTTFSNVEGTPCRCLDSSVQHFPKAYFPFRID